MKKTTALRNLIAAKQILVKPGAYDALSAKLLEKAGFSIVGLSGYCLSVTKLGLPDLSFINLTDVCEAAENINRAIGIPLIVDIDTGFGNALNVMYTTEKVIQTGAAAFHIEDQLFPKRCGFVKGKAVISADEMVGKIKAAKHIRDELDKDFVIIARSDVKGTPGGTIEALIDRCKRYIDAGADMIYPEALKTPEEVERVATELQFPIHLNRSTAVNAPVLTLEQLQKLGITICSEPGGAMRVAAAAIERYANGFYEEDISFALEEEKKLKSTVAANLHDLSGMNEWLALGKQFDEDANRKEE